jgi:Carboxypeptidase regulatory-like domain
MLCLGPFRASVVSPACPLPTPSFRSAQGFDPLIFRRRRGQITWSLRRPRQFAAFLIAWFLMSNPQLFAAQSSAPSATAAPSIPRVVDLSIFVHDENGVAVPRALVTLEAAATQQILKGETDYAGHVEFPGLPEGIYQLHAEKEGFYAVTEPAVKVEEGLTSEVTLNHVKEYSESVNVVYSPPAIDPAKTVSGESLSSQEILDIPSAVPRDIRYSLPLLPGVVQDAYSQVHLDGSSTRQIYDGLDGFNISDPATGLFNLRVNVDSVRSLDVEGSRFPAEYGKGSAGIISLRTDMGDDHFRFSATDFLPAFQNIHGLKLNMWTPRATFAGPLRHRKAWFLEAIDGEYDLNALRDLPAGANTAPVWRLGNLAKAQVNLTPANILTGSFVVNGFSARREGLSPFDPPEATVNENDSAYFASAKDQAALSGGAVAEFGFAISRFATTLNPQGNQPYVITPDTYNGNYFETTHEHIGREQWIANYFAHPLQGAGRHEIKAGIDLDHVSDWESFTRRPISILREDGTLSSSIQFSGNPTFSRENLEGSTYLQDTWSITPRWLAEPGVRLDGDTVLGKVWVSPRVATTCMLSANTKLDLGVGIYYDASNLEILTRALTGERTDLFYDSTGQTLIYPPVLTTFQVDERALREPRFLNWSAGFEKKLPGAVYFKTEFIQKRGVNGWAYVNTGLGPSGELSGQYVLSNQRQDHYDAITFSTRKRFKGEHIVFAAYTRSSARTTAALSFSIDNPLFSQQMGGPLPWDTPNRLQTWGYLPLFWKINLAYALDWHDGFPFYLVNQSQQVVAPPGAKRFPDYFSLDMMLERRFHFLGYEWALRGGFTNISNHPNAASVDNNVDSPHFLTFGGVQGRATVGRIRWLGKK